MRELPDVINWRRLSDRITTSGQPTETQLAGVKALGITQVINLGPHTNDGALGDEPGTVARLGLNYTYIPVDFDAPTQADYDAFCEALERFQDDKIHVHCIYNARVSAFFYRYAKSSPFIDVDMAEIMEGIWRPGGVWADFVDKPSDNQQPNRYAGYDY